jgi:hypothetical protein
MKQSIEHGIEKLDLHVAPALSNMKQSIEHGIAKLDFHVAPALSNMKQSIEHAIATLDLHVTPALSNLKQSIEFGIAELSQASFPSINVSVARLNTASAASSIKDLVQRSRATLEPFVAAGVDRIRGPATELAVPVGSVKISDLLTKADIVSAFSLPVAFVKDMTRRAKRRGIAVARRWLDQLDS